MNTKVDGKARVGARSGDTVPRAVLGTLGPALFPLAGHAPHVVIILSLFFSLSLFPVGCVLILMAVSLYLLFASDALLLSLFLSISFLDLSFSVCQSSSTLTHITYLKLNTFSTFRLRIFFCSLLDCLCFEN